MEISETEVFTKQITALMSDDQYKGLQWELVHNPKKGPVIKNSGGLRKVRWKVKGSGKSGGVRIIYYLVHEDHILMLLGYRKNQQEDLTPKQLKILKTIIDKGYK